MGLDVGCININMSSMNLSKVIDISAYSIYISHQA